MFILSRLARAKKCLRTAFAVAPKCHGFGVAFLAFTGIQAAYSAALSGGSFVETDGWKVRITVDCLLKDKLCGSFRYETFACEGDLIYSGETPTGFEFRTELRSGRCLPGCTIQISGDFKRYAEVCRDSRHEGSLTAAGAPTNAAAPTAAPGPATSRAAPAPRAGLESKGLSGQVQVKLDNGDVFEGQMLDGKRNGKGRMVWANGQSYDGDWRDNVAVGEGALVFVNGDRYQGEVQDGMPHGRGKMQFSNDGTFEGQFNRGIPDVEGVYTEKDGSRYAGQWKAGIKNGRGKFVWANGQSYEGDWIADRPEGKGSMTFKNGDVYTGNWQKGKKVGMGRYRWANGDYWEGEFVDDKRTDAGRLYFTPTVVASGGDGTKLAIQADALAGPSDANAGSSRGATTGERPVDRTELLAIPMVAKEVRDCSRKQGSDCATRVVDDVLSDRLQQHKWQTMASERDAKGKPSVFEVDTNSLLEGGNVFSWLRSGDGTQARNIGIKYDCRAQTLEIQLIYHCKGSQGCVLDPNIDKYAGKILPATDIKSWFKEACER